MSETRQNWISFLFWTAVVLLVGIGFRSKSVTQFFIMAGVTIFGTISVYLAFDYAFKQGFWNTVASIFYVYIAITVFIAVGTLLVTGDYARATKNLWKQPTPTALLQAGDTITTQTPGSTPAAAANAAATPAPTGAPTVAATGQPAQRQPVGAQLELPAAIQPYWSKAFQFLAPGLADTSKALPETADLKTWRLVVGVVLVLQYVLGLVSSLYARQRNVWRDFLLVGLLGVLLIYTRLGEWLYGLFLGISGWGWIGAVVIVVGILLVELVIWLVSIYGVNNLIGNVVLTGILFYIVGSYLYNNLLMVQLCVLPIAGLMAIAIYFSFYQSSFRRYLKS